MYLNAMAKTPTAVKLCEWETGNYWKGYAVELLLFHVFPLNSLWRKASMQILKLRCERQLILK